MLRVGPNILSFIYKRFISIKESIIFLNSVAGQEIINPIQSARMVTENSFSVTYGSIEIRAKMPKGDWIWPGILNEKDYVLYSHLSTIRTNLIALQSYMDVANR